VDLELAITCRKKPSADDHLQKGTPAEGGIQQAFADENPLIPSPG
jgi:hypothetical protein